MSPSKYTDTGCQFQVSNVVDVFNLINHNQAKITESQTMESIEGIPRANLTRYRQLLSRYIDNNIVLVLQENKFPA